MSDIDEIVETKKQSCCCKILRRTSCKEVITVLASVLVPIILGIFTVLSAFNEWHIEKNRSEQESKIEADRYGQQISLNLEKYQNDLLVGYIERMGIILEESNYSLANNVQMIPLIRAQTLNIIRQLDAPRRASVIRFLYESKLIARIDDSIVLDISTANLSHVNKETLVTEKYDGVLALNGVFIESTMFTNILLKNTDFGSTIMKDVDFSSSTTDYDDYFTHERFLKRLSSVIIHVSFASASLYRVLYASAKMQHISFSNSQLQKVSFSSARLFDITFDNMYLFDVNFRYAHIVSVTFSNGHIENMDFSDAFINNVSFRDVTLENVTFDRSFLCNTKFERTKLQNVQFVSATLTGTLFNSNEIRLVSFSRSPRATIQVLGCQLSYVDFSFANLKGATFEGGWPWEYLNFTGANLQYSKMNHIYFADESIRLLSTHGAVAIHTTLQDKNLIAAAPQSCDNMFLDEWDLEESNITSVFLQKTDYGCQFVLNSSFEKAVLSQRISLKSIWDKNAWPVSTALLKTIMSSGVTVELLGVMNREENSLSILLDSNDLSPRRLRLSLDMDELIIRISLHRNIDAAKIEDVWCRQTYLVLEYGTKEDLHPGINYIPSDAKWSKDGTVFMENLTSSSVSVVIEHFSSTVYVLDSLKGYIITRAIGSEKIDIYQKDLNGPTHAVFDTKTSSMIIADRMNRMVVKWFVQNMNIQSQIMIQSIDCSALALDIDNSLYVSDMGENAVLRYPPGKNVGAVVAGGNGPGFGLDQLHGPYSIALDIQGALYISNLGSSRIMKWKIGAKHGIVIAGFGSDDANQKPLNTPLSIFLDLNENLYIADSRNNRIVRYRNNAKTPEILLDSKHVKEPNSITVDASNNLYVTTEGRVIRFSMI